MNVVFFSPHFPPNFYQFSVALKHSGATVLGIGDTPYDRLRKEIQESFTDYIHIDDLSDYDSVLRACGWFIHKHGKIDRFESHNEHWLELEAQIREDLNIIGIRTDFTHTIRQKSFMKRIFQSCGIPVAEGKIVNDFTQAQEFIQTHGFPVVVKPNKGVGAISTFKMDTMDQLQQFFHEKSSEEYIMETFVNGEIQTFDGIVDKKGNLLFCTSMVYSHGVMEIYSSQDHMYYYTQRTIPRELEVLGRKCIQAFQLSERFFHLEFFKTNQHQNGFNGYVGLELNIRPPGGMTMDMYNYASDFNLYQVWADLITGRISQLEYERKYYTCYICRRYDKSYVYSHEDILHTLNESVTHHSEMPQIFTRVMGDYGYIIRTETKEDLLNRIAYIHQTC